jgi:hypothetical protein
METASLSGRVIDSSGATIVAADIELIDEDRNIQHISHTNKVGLYSFVDLKPGHYRMQVTAPGFRVVNLTNLMMNVQDTIEQNFTMAIGSVAESITVEARTAPLDISGAVSTVIDQKLVTQMPLNGRSFQGLIQLTPGVVTAATNNNSQGQFSVNGQRTNANYFTLDGASANAGISTFFSLGQSFAGTVPSFGALGGTNTLVSTDAIQEFAIQSSTYAPEFGRTPGAQISIVSKSGTNAFHGDAFEYLRNDLFDANDWFADHNGVAKPALRQNDFGGVVGGPVRKDKTFFFISYEALRLRQPTTVISDVPTLATRQAAPAVLQPFFNAYPLPTGADEGNGLALAAYGFSNPSTLNAVSGRVDHRISNKLTAFARYGYSPSSTSNRNVGGTPANIATVATVNSQTLTVGLTAAINSTIANDARFNWTSTSGATYLTADTFGGAQALPNILPAPFTFANGQEQIVLSSEARNGSLTAGSNVANRQRQINFVDSVSWQLHDHLLKAGVDYRRLSPTIGPTEYSQFAQFSTIASTASLTADLFGGVVSGDYVRAKYVNYSLYAQDTWSPLPRLHITYGLRWDYNPTPTGRGQSGLSPVTVQGTYPNFSLAPPGTPLYHATKDNFAPRFGFAYQVHNSAAWASVLRAGFGLFSDTTGSAVGVAFILPPFSGFNDLTGHPFPYSPADAAPPALGLTSPLDNAVMAFVNPLKAPYTYQWNLAIEQSIGRAQTLTVGYVGAAGHSLLRQETINASAALPSEFALGGLILGTNDGYSHYNALQALFRRRATQHLDVLASYTLAHSLDNVSTDSINSLPFSGFLDPRSDYGPSDFDVRHTATFGADYSVPTVGDSKVLRALTSGWGIDPLVTVRSSPPVDVLIRRNIGFGSELLRPDLVPGAPLYIYDASLPGGRQISPSAFSVSSTLRQGTLSRNALRGFRLVQPDIAIHRTFAITEKIQLQARLEVFNVVNMPSFAAPASRLGSVNSSGMLTLRNGFGVSPSTLAAGLNTIGGGSGFNPLYQIGGPRSLQLGVRIEF